MADQLPNIPLGFTSKTPEPQPGEEDQEGEEGVSLEVVAMLLEAKAEANHTTSNIFLAALDRPIPESFVAGQTFPHPFWDEEQEAQVKHKYLTFLLSL